MTAFNSSFFNQRADEAARMAGETRLANVRNSHLQAERAWRTMAERASDAEEFAAVRHAKTSPSNQEERS